ncbi:rod shape-determining protein MreC [Desulfovibrio inopinatus]|uniref:rod shape-determining protein MreC n=1 Tax=Desulfovibrio inopinatus TaxID=102109 RepID=UPI001FE0B331|nr:rod shape-determining protein MreC [Desulfovibrio inopinatus]
MSSYTGLEFVRWVLSPGKWVSERVGGFWDRYVYFVGVREENEQLKERLGAAEAELAELREQRAEVKRLRALLDMVPPIGRRMEGARILAHRLGPNAALETILLDKGLHHGLSINVPVVSPDGVVGRILRISPNASTVLLVTDPNSRIPVVGQTSRAQGILIGRGPHEEMSVEYVSQQAEIQPGELLVTSGVEAFFPKGLPVARVTRVEPTGSRLFQNVHAAPLFQKDGLEEVGLLIPFDEEVEIEAGTGMAARIPKLDKNESRLEDDAKKHSGGDK